MIADVMHEEVSQVSTQVCILGTRKADAMLKICVTTSRREIRFRGAETGGEEGSWTIGGDGDGGGAVSTRATFVPRSTSSSLQRFPIKRCG